MPNYKISNTQSGVCIRKLGIDFDRALKISFHCQMIQEKSNPDSLSGDEFCALLGMKKIRGTPFLIIVRETSNVCTFQGSQIYEIKAIDFFPLLAQNQNCTDPEVFEDIAKITKLFSEGKHYFSDHYKLYKSFNQNIESGSMEQEQYYEQFIWNQKIMRFDIPKQTQKELYGTSEQYRQQSEVLKNWCTPIIQGYVDFFEAELPDTIKMPYLLISRRSNRKAGTRFFSRGIDDEGNVANFTESQQIVQLENKVYSHIQVRGSVPVFFEQVGMEGINIELSIKRSPELTASSFRRHFSAIREMYGRALCVNLLSEQKASEKRLTAFFEEMYHHSEKELRDLVKYKFFDFHQECKNNQFQNSARLVKDLMHVVRDFGYHAFDRKTSKVVRRQMGVFRTNCLDCLDRTNYVMSRLALRALENMVAENTCSQTQQSIAELQVFAQSEMAKNSELVNSFNHVWAENGDAISFHYTGIGSTHTEYFLAQVISITRTGKRTFLGGMSHKMRSLMRFYTQFTDVEKHDTINDFLGNRSSAHFDERTLDQGQVSYKSLECLSWEFTAPELCVQNFHKGLHSNATYRFIRKRIKAQDGKVGVFAIYLYCPNWLINWQSNLKLLSPFHRPAAEAEVLKLWSGFLCSEMQANGYTLIDTNSDDFNHLLLFCLKHDTPLVSNIQNDRIATPTKTNEVVLVTKFRFRHSSLVFQASNVKNLDSFIQLIEKAHSLGFQYRDLGKQKSSKIEGQSYRLIMGNIGSRSKGKLQENEILEKDKEVAKIVDSGGLSDLETTNRFYALVEEGYSNDEYKEMEESMRMKSETLSNYSEPPLQFIAGNNRIMFWNQCGKLVRVGDYTKSFELESPQSPDNHSVHCSLSYEIDGV